MLDYSRDDKILSQLHENAWKMVQNEWDAK